MVRRTRAIACATVLGAAAWLLSGCGGQSNAEDGGSGKGGGSGGSGTGGSAPGCEYNGVRYEPGDVFGECKQCACTPTGGVACDLIGCDPGAGGTGGMTSAGGAAGSVSAGTGQMSGGAAGTGGSIEKGCELGDIHYPSGASWPSDCNTCYCKAGTISCTTIDCNPGSGGAGGNGVGGSAGGGTGGGGAGGEAGSPSSCTYEPIRSFCVLGTPTSEGQCFELGAPIMLSVAASGCYSSSCTKLVSSDCNYISNGNEYMISTFLCLETEGDACTDDCGGVGDVLCDPGLTFSEPGTYTISIRPDLVVKLQVPSVVARATELCADLLTR